MDEWVKKVKLKISADEDDLDKVEKQLSALQEIKVGFKDTLSSKFKFDGKTFGSNVANKLTSVVDKSLDKLKNVLSDAWEELGNMVGYSTLSNARTRDLAFTYGFSGSQAYGYDKAMNIMGFESIEDLMFANESQREKFQEMMTKYTDKYQQLYDSGFFEQYLDFQYEMEDFKQEILTEVVQFFMDNKDTIMTGMRSMISLTEFTIEALGWLVKFFGGNSQAMSSSQRAANTTDIINNYGASNKSTNVTIDNTFNNVAKEDQSWLSNAGQMTYQQVIQALT